jgi:hypothetical protein
MVIELRSTRIVDIAHKILTRAETARCRFLNTDANANLYSEPYSREQRRLFL